MKSIKPNNMANLDQALAYNAHKPRELPSDNIQTLNVKETKGKAGISRTRISHGAIALDNETPPRLLKQKQPVNEGDQFIFDSVGLDDNGDERKRNQNRLLLEDVEDENSVKVNLN